MSTPLLSVEDLETSFQIDGGLIRAVSKVSFQVARGEILGLVGESGSGKSVTGFSILGLVRPPGRITGGRILFDGQDLITLSEPEKRKIRGVRIAMVFQDHMMTLNPVLRVRTQLIDAIQAHETVSTSVARQRAIEALDAVGIPSPEKRLDNYPHEFSGAMRQRVAIAISILHKPDLIIAD